MPNGIYFVSDLIDGDGSRSTNTNKFKDVNRRSGDYFDFSEGKETKSPLKCSKGALFNGKAAFKAVVDLIARQTKGGLGP